MFRRILGLIIIIATVAVLVFLIAIAYYWGPTVESVSEEFETGLALTIETLHTVSATLEQTQATLVSVNSAMETATETTVNLSKTVGDTIPLLEQVAVVVSDQVPQNIESIQTAIPNVAAVAGVVDDALTTLSNFGISQTIPLPFNPIEIDFDLGIDYQPVEPFDETLMDVGTSLDGLPEELRNLRSELEVSTANLETVSNDMLAASGDLEAINSEVANFIPLLDEYLVLLDRVIELVERLNTQISANLSTVKLVGTILPIALALTQLAPLVVGWELLTGKRQPQVIVKEAEVQGELASGDILDLDINEYEGHDASNEIEDTLVEDFDSAGPDEGA